MLDSGSSHLGDAAVRRLQQVHAKLVPVHLPINASWLNQVELYCSILQRKVLTPPEAESLVDVAAVILGFQASYEELGRPFEWKFTRADLAKLLARLAAQGHANLVEAARIHHRTSVPEH